MIEEQVVSRNSVPCMKPEGPLPCPAMGPNTEPHDLFIVFLYDDFNMTFMLGSSKRCVFYRIFNVHFLHISDACYMPCMFCQQCLAKGRNYDASCYAELLSPLLLHLF